MKKKDFYFILFLTAVFLPFFIFDEVLSFYNKFNDSNGMIMSFIKFGFLATLGEVIGLRIKTGEYIQKTFGILPKAIVWGVLGLFIKLAFVVFATGVPQFIKYLGYSFPPDVMKSSFGFDKLLIAFSISLIMNIIFAPVMMTIHKITDEHISRNQGKLTSLIKPINVGDIFVSINWKVMWNFVFKKTIPLFWIPAHTITFLLPVNHQVLFAAVLGIVLGILLAIASKMNKN